MVLPTRRGSLPLFRFSGVQVYLHWSWFLVLVYMIQVRRGAYSSILWNVAECLSLFLIVLLHEFGHSLACRSVGGQANQIMLWPFGGVAYVKPPQRPGATLWSIAAGPLVNVVLAPMLTVLVALGRSFGWPDGDAFRLLNTIWDINIGLLMFNMLPLYPLDGGQILQSLLWFVIGRARSMLVASIIGLCGTVGLFVVIGVFTDGLERIWGLLIVGFLGMMCWRGLLYARILSKVARLPHRVGYACPSCRQQPIIGAFWTCSNCGHRFDMFDTQATCPNCRAYFPATPCLDCGEANPFPDWIMADALPPRVNLQA
ncbi:MAG TPA: site-2 protease family protein [Verrucomicrobiae bacterium]|nr:site-2 protease family protein [Verrucomicrobiae bacterium]